jgi:hypothetical protein
MLAELEYDLSLSQTRISQLESQNIEFEKKIYQQTEKQQIIHTLRSQLDTAQIEIVQIKQQCEQDIKRIQDVNIKKNKIYYLFSKLYILFPIIIYILLFCILIFYLFYLYFLFFRIPMNY